MAARRQRDRAENADEVTVDKQPKETDRDANRRKALSELASAGALPQEPAEDSPEFSGEPVPFGGDVKVGVLFTDYVARVDGVWRKAHRGDVVTVSDEAADRGVSLGGLVRL